MNRIKFITMPLFVAASMIFTIAAFTITIRAQSAAGNSPYSIDLPAVSADSTKFSFGSIASVNVTNIKELYAAVNNPNNAGNQIVIAPGVYMLSASAPNGMPRPNGGRGHGKIGRPKTSVFWTY